MKILDQNVQLSAQHYARSESRVQNIHDIFVDGMLKSRTTETASSESESLELIDQREKRMSSTDHHNRKTGVIENQQFAAMRHRQTLQAEKLTQHFGPLPEQATAAQSQKADNKPALPPNLIRMIEAIEALMEKMTGKPYHLKVYGYEPRDTTSAETTKQTPDKGLQNPVFRLPDIGGFQRPVGQASQHGERWRLYSSHFEQEQTDFRAQGNVTTTDGKQIAFDLNMQMSRTFSAQVSSEREKGFVLKDPLTVNFGGTPATLTVEKVQFDIDSDGQEDSISFVQPGSGFLTLDKNGDGTVNDGSELFGTQSGNGFADLSAYDEDGNGWIDENDSVFAKLQIWHKDANGLDQLQGLLELNIGAISLQNVDTPFSYKDDTNRMQGQAVSSGLFLYEDGSGAGSVQQIDLAV
ncbi:hypothetical protein QCB45_02410 [Thiomicrorhabdus sp. ZW0627]|uniref:hypothetical protein n=1 Tax=Thiomicrorhabdus sp. ZW0627 TaxID=3039774 RepID=UPI0024362E56|nr:hypothetical protein [Thiomicrorhabdus sp. ZW0627]MDG6773169.1 hypothetical protein [Thiomicrorhabdus sp. ZW0627]